MEYFISIEIDISISHSPSTDNWRIDSRNWTSIVLIYFDCIRFHCYYHFSISDLQHKISSNPNTLCLYPHFESTSAWSNHFAIDSAHLQSCISFALFWYLEKYAHCCYCYSHCQTKIHSDYYQINLWVFCMPLTFSDHIV